MIQLLLLLPGFIGCLLFLYGILLVIVSKNKNKARKWIGIFAVLIGFVTLTQTYRTYQAFDSLVYRARLEDGKIIHADDCYVNEKNQNVCDFAFGKSVIVRDYWVK